jgi:acyl-CoA dehydrogenase
VFGYDDAPHGHAEVLFDNVRVPRANILLGEGRGFEIAQGRLGPGRIHHCMRTIGVAERALASMVKRLHSREAFGKKIAHLGGNMQIIAQARCEIEAMRLMVLKAAKAMDVLGNKEARIWVSMVKAMVPERTCKIIDQAIQMHGATGISHWSPLGEMYQDVRHLRFADGPDEVHWMVVGRHELSMP